MTDLATTSPTNGAGADIIERVIAAGDLARLSPEERTRYYGEVCRSLGLNPLTQPFQYLSLNQKLVLYATRGATDQLRKIHGVSTAILSRETVGDVYVVTARATDPRGRSDESIGAVAIGGLKGDALCNALMKCETKAKRRATLAIVGLSFLDETEIDTIPGARVEEPDPGPSPKMAALRQHLDEAVAEGDSTAVLVGMAHALADGETLDEYRRTQHEQEQPPVERVPGDDVDSLSGDALVDACDRMKRRLDAHRLPYPAIPPKGQRTVPGLRAWWHAGAALLSARP